VARLDSEGAGHGAVPDPDTPDLRAWLGRGSEHDRRLVGLRFEWPLAVRARVWLRRFSLDQRLASGADPRSSPELARRAQELCQLRLRRQLSADIERTIEAASIPDRWLTAAIPISRRSITECRPLLLGLAQDLRCAGPLYARGIALVRLLLMDGGSPLYAPSEPCQLEEEIHRARSALLRG
jgi:hypothetical protein